MRRCTYTPMRALPKRRPGSGEPGRSLKNLRCVNQVTRYVGDLAHNYQTTKAWDRVAPRATRSGRMTMIGTLSRGIRYAYRYWTSSDERGRLCLPSALGSPRGRRGYT